MDLTGKVVFTANNVNNQTAINLSGLQKGMYLAKITGTDLQTTEKIILKYSESQLNTFGRYEYIDETEYIIKWEYVTAHLTKKAAELFIEENKHRYNELRIFVNSQYRCKEWNELTDIIKKNF
jgi:cell division ATPase FtsA